MSETDLSPAPTSSPRARRRLTAQETRVRHRRVAMWTLSLMLGALLVNAVVGENGYLATVRAAREEAALRTTVAQLRLENQHLQAEGRRLQTDPTAVEEVARRELGMVRSGETMIVIRDATSAAPSVSK
jgi:cell division protein FtsB